MGLEVDLRILLVEFGHSVVAAVQHLFGRDLKIVQKLHVLLSAVHDELCHFGMLFVYVLYYGLSDLLLFFHGDV